MPDQFSRTQLVLGKNAMNILKNSRVIIFGVGGVGGFAAEALARSDVGTIDLVDDDLVCLTNLNRQLIALRDTVGKYKTEVMADRIRSINPDCVVNEHRTFFLPENKEEFDFSTYDYVVDAVDTMKAKIALVMACQETKTKIISCMGAGNKIHPEMLEVADIYKTSMDPLAKVMRRELKKRRVRHLKVVYSKEKPLRPIEDMADSCRYHCICPPGTKHRCIERRDIPGSTAFVPPTAGMIIAAEVVRDLTYEAMMEERKEAGLI